MNQFADWQAAFEARLMQAATEQAAIFEAFAARHDRASQLTAEGVQNLESSVKQIAKEMNKILDRLQSEKAEEVLPSQKITSPDIVCSEAECPNDEVTSRSKGSDVEDWERVASAPATAREAEKQAPARSESNGQLLSRTTMAKETATSARQCPGVAPLASKVGLSGLRHVQSVTHLQSPYQSQMPSLQQTSHQSFGAHAQVQQAPMRAPVQVFHASAGTRSVPAPPRGLDESSTAWATPAGFPTPFQVRQMPPRQPLANPLAVNAPTINRPSRSHSSGAIRQVLRVAG